MSVLSSIKPAPWPLSPELTEAPEIWRSDGGAFCYPNWTMDNLVRAITDAPALPLINGAFFGGSDKGYGLKLDTSNWARKKSISPPFSWPVGADDESIIIHTLFNVTQLGGDDAASIFTCHPHGGNGKAGFKIKVEGSNPSNVVFRTFGSNSTGDTTTDARILLNTTVLVSVGWEVGVGYDVYVDGILGSTTSTSDGGPLDTIDITMGVDRELGNSNTVTGASGSGTTYYVFWKHAMNPLELVKTEARTLARDPFAMLRPRSDL